MRSRMITSKWRPCAVKGVIGINRAGSRAVACPSRSNWVLGVLGGIVQEVLLVPMHGQGGA